MDNQSDLIDSKNSELRNINLKVIRTPKYEKKFSVYEEGEKFVFDKSAFSRVNSEIKFKNTTTQNWSTPKKYGPIKAIHYGKKEVKKSTFYSKPTIRDNLFKSKDEIHEERKIIEHLNSSKNMNTASNVHRLKKSNSQKYKFLIRPFKLKSVDQSNVAKTNNA